VGIHTATVTAISGVAALLSYHNAQIIHSDREKKLAEVSGLTTAHCFTRLAVVGADTFMLSDTRSYCGVAHAKFGGLHSPAASFFWLEASL
jgi:hypothetical protein